MRWNVRNVNTLFVINAPKRYSANAAKISPDNNQEKFTNYIALCSPNWNSAVQTSNQAATLSLNTNSWTTTYVKTAFAVTNPAPTTVATKNSQKPN